MTEANRGKSTEAEVTKYLKAYDAKHQDFDWARNYDSHSAGGRFQRQTGDFQFYGPGVHGVIEAKEVKHTFRVPHTNFTKEAVAKVWKRQLAGGEIIVLIHHSEAKLWRVVPLHVFRERVGGSWDLSAWRPLPSCAAALDSLGVFV